MFDWYFKLPICQKSCKSEDCYYAKGSLNKTHYGIIFWLPSIFCPQFTYVLLLNFKLAVTIKHFSSVTGITFNDDQVNIFTLHKGVQRKFQPEFEDTELHLHRTTGVKARWNKHGESPVAPVLLNEPFSFLSFHFIIVLKQHCFSNVIVLTVTKQIWKFYYMFGFI